ncbi:MAG: hypothetical protein VW082_05890 [Candidatus Nanopelagicales bacterium]
MGQQWEVGVGAARCAVTLDLGELHPSGHGAFRLDLEVEGDLVVAARPRPGLLHRGVEKLMEARDYRQALALADRHDWLSSVTSEVTLALAVEELLGLEVPPRAVWLRTILSEISRAAASLLHLAGAATVPPRGQAPTEVPGMAAREAWLDCLEAFSGNRVHAMTTRIGGLANDAPDDWTSLVRRAIESTRAQLPDLLTAVYDVVPAGVGILSPAQARTWAVSGPVARASGLDQDLRRDVPVLAYPELADVIEVVTGVDGDARERYRVLAEQVLADMRLLDTALDRLPEGPIDVPLPKVVRAPEGAAYARMESAIGVNGAYLVSAGGPTPWRVRWRTASFANVQAMSAALPGTPVDDLAAVVGSFLFVVGDLDH